MKEGKLGKGKYTILIAGGLQTLMQLGERFFGVLVEHFIEIPIEKLLGRK